MKIDVLRVFKVFGVKFYKERIFEKFMILTERLEGFRSYLRNNIIPINIYGSDALLAVGVGLVLSAGYVGESSSEMNMGMYAAVTGVCLRIAAGRAKRLSERNTRLEKRLAEERNTRLEKRLAEERTKEMFSRIDSRDGFYDA